MSVGKGEISEDKFTIHGCFTLTGTDTPQSIYVVSETIIPPQNTWTDHYKIEKYGAHIPIQVILS